MNDRLLYRAICNDGKFHYGYLARLYKDNEYGKKGDFCISNNSFCPYAYLVTRPETIGQCTGLKDKNGKLIYEGDIIQKENQKFVIKYDFDSFKAYDEENKPISIYGLFTFKICSGGWPGKETENTIEIIGNIHENPELLEQSND